MLSFFDFDKIAVLEKHLSLWVNKLRLAMEPSAIG
jgi:hypothetical protein